MELRITIGRVGGATVLTLEGVADLASVPLLHRALAPLGSEGGTVVVDLDGVTVLDDVAVGLLVGAAARARDADGELVLVASAPRIVERIERLRLDRVVRVTASITAAGRG